MNTKGYNGMNPQDKQLKVLHVGLVLGHGGDAFQMLELAAGLAVRGHDMRLVVPANDATLLLEQRARERGVPIERSPALRVDGVGARQSLMGLVKLFRSSPDTVLHLHSGDICLPRRVLLALKLVRAPAVFATIHGSYVTMSPGSLRARAWCVAANRHIRHVVCPSEHSRQLQISFGIEPSRAVTLRNGVDIARIKCGRRERIRAALRLDESSPLVLFSSRLEPGKRPMDALNAFGRIASRHPAALLAFVGCGSLDTALKTEAARLGLQGRVHFPGFQHEVADWLAACDIWVFPTEGENFSLALLEAMAADCAILSTMCRGNNEVLQEGCNALTTAVGDVDEMTVKLDRLLGDPALRRRLAAGASRAVEPFSMLHMLDSYQQLYETCAAPHVSPLRLAA